MKYIRFLLLIFFSSSAMADTCPVSSYTAFQASSNLPWQITIWCGGGPSFTLETYDDAAAIVLSYAALSNEPLFQYTNPLGGIITSITLHRASEFANDSSPSTIIWGEGQVYGDDEIGRSWSYNLTSYFDNGGKMRSAAVATMVSAMVGNVFYKDRVINPITGMRTIKFD